MSQSEGQAENKQPIAKIEIEYNMVTGEMKMSSPSNATLCYGVLELAKETLIKNRIKQEIAKEILEVGKKDEIIRPNPAEVAKLAQ